ncbi:hypothetical protein [Pseudonocardia kunmingensis]|uniref:Uncharacterized protein n=1 Tax=Pseudonocardia kunmingensis TaxID=630975 RepID=A0A543E204_9PSEU|nr:hypothetical protein [Pseudonocardia kunmingensis]TQM15610.1 hypothetical protein FB558_2400 [Pseudonocardia kunmingensis]
MAREPGMATRLLAAHVDDGAGRCRVCSIGGQAGRAAAWPCLIRLYADQAQATVRGVDRIAPTAAHLLGG